MGIKPAQLQSDAHTRSKCFSFVDRHIRQRCHNGYGFASLQQFGALVCLSSGLSTNRLHASSAGAASLVLAMRAMRAFAFAMRVCNYHDCVGGHVFGTLVWLSSRVMTTDGRLFIRTI